MVGDNAHPAYSNRFYLNCLQEPVQELSENESEVYVCSDFSGLQDYLLDEMCDINEATDMKKSGLENSVTEMKDDLNTDKGLEMENDSDNCYEVETQQISSESKCDLISVNDPESTSVDYDEKYNNLEHLPIPNTEILSLEQHLPQNLDDHEIERRNLYITNRPRDVADQDRSCSIIKKYVNGILMGTVLLALCSIFLSRYLSVPESLEEDLPIYQEDFKEDLTDSFEALPVIQKTYDVPTALKYCSDKHQSDDLLKEINVKKCLSKIDRRIQRAKEKEKLLNKEMYLEVKEKYLEEREKNLLKREYEVLQSEFNLKYQKSLKQMTKENLESKNVFKEEHNQKNPEKSRGRSKSKNAGRKDKDDTQFRGNANEINKISDKPTKKTYCRFVERNENKKNYKSKHIDNEDDDDQNETVRDSGKKHKNRNKYIDNTEYSKNESKNLETKYRNNFNKNEKKYKFERSNKLNENNQKYSGKKRRMSFDEEAKWYFDWMKGREVLRYIETYYG